MTNTTKKTGAAAITLSETTGVQLRKYADPVDGAREVSLEEAREIAKADPSLIYCYCRPTMTAAVGSDGTRLVVWGLGETEAEALADAARQEHGGEEMTCHEVTEAHAAIVHGGNITWPVA